MSEFVILDSSEFSKFIQRAVQPSRKGKANCPQCGFSQTISDSNCNATTIQCLYCGCTQSIDHNKATVEITKGYGCAYLNYTNGTTIPVTFFQPMHWEERKNHLFDLLLNAIDLKFIVMTRKRRGQWLVGYLRASPPTHHHTLPKNTCILPDDI